MSKRLPSEAPHITGHPAAPLFHGEEGQTTVIMVLVLATFLIGFVAFGIDVQALFQGRRQAQAAADAAAVAYAEESGNGAAAQMAAATAMVRLNGISTTPVINSPPTSGNYTSGTGSNYYEAVVSVPVSTFFAPMFTHHSTVMVQGRAVAGAGLTSPSCVCLEGTTGNDLSLSNNSKLSPTNCGTTVDSSSSNAVSIIGSATLSGLAIGSVSTNWDNATNVNNNGTIASGTKVVQGIATSCAPPLPAAPSYSAASCTADPLTHYSNGTSYSVGPASTYSTTQTGNLVCYNSLSIGSNGDTVNLNPGTYVINGGTLHFFSGTATGGTGVFFYLTNNANFVVDNGANVTLSAPTSGTYSGVLFDQDRIDTKDISMQGGANFRITGSIYAPSASVLLGNGSGTTISADLVASRLTMNGGGTLASPAAANFGSLNLSTAKLGE